MRVSRTISIYRAQRSQQGCSLSLGMLRLAEPPTGRARLRSSLKSPRNPITPIETSRVATLHPELYKNLREGARRVIGATAKPLYAIDGKAEGLDRRRKSYSFPKLKFMRQNAEPCACLRRILLILYLIRRGQSMSLPFSGGNIRPERRKFNKSNSPLPPPLTALKFLNIPALFFRNSLDFAARHRLQ